jgi:hypothetical protein
MLSTDLMRSALQRSKDSSASSRSCIAPAQSPCATLKQQEPWLAAEESIQDTTRLVHHSPPDT